MANRYLVVSDLHLCDVEDNPDGWMAYKSSRYLFDGEFAELLKDFQRRAAPGDALTLVLNGDVFDFDLISEVPADPPWPVSPAERYHGLRSTASKSAWKLELILGHHSWFLMALADFLCAGHRVVYVMGNHDREMHFPEVRGVLHDQLHIAARGKGKDFDPGQIRYEPWFFYQAGEIYAEHGQQYDYYTSFRNLLCPVVEGRQGPMLALPMGNLSNRYLMTRMGFFNPFATDYIRNLFSYLWHWLRHYAFSRRSLALAWLAGSLVVLGKLLATKKRQLRRPKSCPEILEDISTRTRLPPDTLAALESLQRPPIANRFFRMAREFWMDRLVLFVMMVGGTIALALVPIPLWIKLMVPLCVFPLVFFIYESFAHGETVFSAEHEIPAVARQVARLIDAPVVAFGHDHVPRLLPIDRQSTFVDTGTWAPILNERGDLAAGYRNYLVAVFEEGRPPALHFSSWQEPHDRGDKSKE
jgi:hypothetical protein